MKNKFVNDNKENYFIKIDNDTIILTIIKEIINLDLYNDGYIKKCQNIKKLIIINENNNKLRNIKITFNFNNIIIKGNYPNLEKINCKCNKIDYLELNGNFETKFNIKQLNLNDYINILKFIGTFNNFLCKTKINLKIFDNYISLTNNENKIINGNTIFLKDNQYKCLKIKNNCIINNKNSNINNIIIYENCNNIILKGNYPNLKTIECLGDLDYLELNGNFEKNLELNNKNINKLKFSGNFKLCSITNSKINNFIFDNCNCIRNVLYVDNNITFLNNVNIQKLIFNKYIYEIKGNLSNIKEIEYNNCKDLKEIPYKFVNIEKLKLTNCNNIFNIPNIFYNLKKLELKNCNNIKKIPINLNYLDINNCNNIKNINYLINLNHLSLINCNNIKEISKYFINLNYLNINKCKNINKIPDTLIKLDNLIIKNDNLIKFLPNTLKNIPNLDYDYLELFKSIIKNKIDINNYFNLKKIFNILN